MPLTRIQKIGAGSAAAAVSATALLGGTYATFVVSTPAPAQSIASGTVALALNAANQNTGVVAQNISNIAAGDTVNRFVDVKNSGNLTWKGLTLSTTAGSSILLTDATHGVTLAVSSCSGTKGWNTTNGNCENTDGTAGTTAVVLAATKLSTPLANVTLPTFPAAPDATTKYKLTYLLPSTADKTFMTKTDSTTLTFEATQRDATTTSA